MNRKMSWGIAALIIILIAAGGFIYYQWSQVQQLKEQLAQDDKLLEENNKPKVQHAASTSDTKPPDEPGFEWVRHGDHWDKVPIELIGQQTPTEPPVQVKEPEKPAYTGPLTYHAELLKTNPVKALRLQAEERGHWSSKWIPPFPPDDLEAAEIARTQYLIIYYETIGDTKHPQYQKALKVDAELAKREAKALREAYNGRVADLIILSWPRFPESDVPPLYENGWRKSPSDYFPESIEDLKFPLSNPK